MCKRIVFVAVVSVVMLMNTALNAQQDPQYTNYMYNTMSINPAYAGSREVLSGVLLHRSQWTGIDGAPTTQTLSVHSPVGGEKVGLGVNILNDEIGPAKETFFDLNFSYSLRLNYETQLRFGLKAGGHILDVDYNRLHIYDYSDPRYQNSIDNKFSPQLGLGVMLHSDKYYVGISAPNVLETKHFDESENSNSSIAEERINYYLISGYVFDLSRELKFKPTVLAKMVLGTPLQVDVSANFLLYEKLTLGAAYRWSSAVSGLVGFQFSESFMLGFAYDFDTDDIQEYNDGSYEVFLRYELFKKYQKMLTPRFF